MSSDRLRKAVEQFLTNSLDNHSYGPGDGEWSDGDGLPVDSDGDSWFPDIWELKEALKECKPAADDEGINNPFYGTPYDYVNGAVVAVKPQSPDRDELKAAVAALHRLTTISLVWSVDDMLEERPHLSQDEAMEVLLEVKRRHDASIGVNWDTLRDTADDLYPR